jgi:hypothetical protein
MVNAASLFSQILHHFPRAEFAALVNKHDAERHAKGFSCRARFVAMMFCQFARAESLREICNGLRCGLGKIVHLGVNNAPNKSTLAYANQRRPAQLYEDLFHAAYAHFRKLGGFGHRKAKFRFKNKLLSHDSTTISLCPSIFPWAKFRRAKGGVKVHTTLDHDSYMPVFISITCAKPHDVKAARLLTLNPGSIIALDRAYNDYELFALRTKQGVFFVTRMKDNAVYRVIEDRPVPQNRNIIADRIIVLTGVKAEEKCPGPLRRIVVWDAEREREIVLLANHLEFGPTTIADIYKDRWEIELFFKALKQTLKIKTFVGASENALRVQIWTALIAMLVLKWLHHLSKADWSFANLAYLISLGLFTYRDLIDWLHHPFEVEPIIPSPQQLSFPFAALGQPRPLAKEGTST